MLRRSIGLPLLLILLGACAAPAPLVTRVTPNPVMLGPVQYYAGPKKGLPRPVEDDSASDTSPSALARAPFFFSTLLPSQTYSESEESVTETETTAQGSLDAALISAVAGSARGRVTLTDVRCTSWVFFAFIAIASQQGCEALGTAEFPKGLADPQDGSEDAPPASSPPM